MTTREQAIAEQICMTPGPCDDCAEPFRSYMVHDDVWQRAGLPEFGALVCMPCLQERVGRELSGADFPRYPVNEWFVAEAP